MANWKKWMCPLLAIVCLLKINTVTVRAEDYWPAGPEVSGEAAVVMEASTGTVLYEKNAHEHLYPASITKIMTTLLAIEKSGLDEQVTFSHDAIYKTEGTGISRDVDEVMTMKDCLYAVMVNSANECAYAVAEHTGGTVENFVKMMNDKAQKLGCKDTHFNNPHGLPDEQHYTCSYDMALISQAALKNETFRTITGTKKYKIPVTNKHPNEETPMVNHHKMLAPYQGESQYLYVYCIGGKTGYTNAARSTLVTFAEKDGMTLICVIMKVESPGQYTDTRNLLDYCFENFQMWNIAQNENANQSKAAESNLFGKEDAFLKLDTSGNIILPKSASFADAKPELTEKENSQDVAATIRYTYGGRVVGGTDIRLTGAKVKPFPFHKDKKEDVIYISMKQIILGIGAVILVAGLGFGCYHLIDNFYLIRYNRILKKERSLGEIKYRRGRRGRRRK